MLPEACANVVDDDGDGLADCADPDCDGSCPESCDDARDNDADGAVDCDDQDCVGACPEDCANGWDDDGDGRIDCSDVDCVMASCSEVCADGRDNDADGLADCLDADCDGECPEACTDGRDNDGNGLADCNDPFCDASCPESCLNGVDDDGDLLVDCGDPECLAACDVDGDGHISDELGGDDCDDLRVNTFPGASEVCNEIDDDCDTYIDEADPDLDRETLALWSADGDGDGFGDASQTLLACFPPDGWVLDPTDCDDEDPAVHPAADETCNGIDDDCDAIVDDGDPTLDTSTWLPWWPDADGDGFGTAVGGILACVPADGFVDNDDDCDDDDALVYPTTWWPDGDGDGFGAGAPGHDGECEAPLPDWVAVHLGHDCNDLDPSIAPDADEVCDDGVDQDCDALDAPCTREFLAVRNSSYTVVAIDITTFAEREIGPLGVNFWFGGITWDPVSETAWMVDGSATSNLWTVDPYTGTATLVGNMGTNKNFAIAWDPERETLWVAAETGIYEVDPVTAASTKITLTVPGTFDGLTWDSDRNALMALLGGAGDVYEVDRDTGVLTLVFDGPWINNCGWAFDPVAHHYWATDLSSDLYAYFDDPWSQTVAWNLSQAHDGLAYVGDALIR